MKTKNSLSSKFRQENLVQDSGMSGFAKFELESDNESKTFIKNLQTKSPLLVQKALYLEPSKPKMAHIYLMSSAGGILQGDDLEIEIVAGQNTNSLVTTQAATKVFKSESQPSHQRINILINKESFLGFLPNQIIPHKSAKYFQDVNIRIDKTSTLIYSEIISAGRIAHGEKFDFSWIKMRLNCCDFDNKLLFSETLNIEPENKKQILESLFGEKNLFSTIYIVSQVLDSEKMIKNIHKLYQKRPLIGYSFLPNNAGVLVRILSNSIDEINNVVYELKLHVQNQGPSF